MRSFIALRSCLGLIKPSNICNAIISRSTVWSDGQTLTASALNGELNVIQNDYNGNITNANISANAAIATSKINATFPSGAIVGTTDSQTLTNKTLVTPTVATINSPTSSDLALTADTANNKVATITTRRQGGSATDWSSAGTNNYTESGVFIQTGALSTPNSNTEYTITFPVAFSQVPIVIASVVNATNYNTQGNLRSVSTANFKTSSAFTDAGTVTYWIAIGKR